MNTESYLNHPTFGLLYMICRVGEDQELFASLYAQRLFFVVTGNTGKINQRITFEPVTRGDARFMVENRLRTLRRLGKMEEYQQLQQIYHQTFQ